jgi:hypothetical protein
MSKKTSFDALETADGITPRNNIKVVFGDLMLR